MQEMIWCLVALLWQMKKKGTHASRALNTPFT